IGEDLFNVSIRRKDQREGLLAGKRRISRRQGWEVDVLCSRDAAQKRRGNEQPGGEEAAEHGGVFSSAARGSQRAKLSKWVGQSLWPFSLSVDDLLSSRPGRAPTAAPPPKSR